MKHSGRRRGINALIVGACLFGVMGVGSLIAPKQGDDAPETSARGTAWGEEAASVLGEGFSRFSLISAANACGLGASSCFKCHNGKRAKAPNDDAMVAPWHAQHGKVNNSCVGCHKGNSRMMKEELAHAGMLSDPRSNTWEACSSCHTSDLSKVQGAYSSVPAQGK